MRYLSNTNPNSVEAVQALQTPEAFVELTNLCSNVVQINNGVFTIFRPTGSLHCKEFDYVVKDPYGHLNILHPTTFVEQFTPVE